MPLFEVHSYATMRRYRDLLSAQQAQFANLGGPSTQ
jgi:hypothetical protein